MLDPLRFAPICVGESRVDVRDTVRDHWYPKNRWYDWIKLLVDPASDS